MYYIYITALRILETAPRVFTLSLLKFLRSKVGYLTKILFQYAHEESGQYVNVLINALKLLIDI